MDSVKQCLALFLLSIWSVGSAPSSNGNGTWIFVPAVKASFTLQPRNESLIQPRWTAMPRSFESLIDKLDNKEEKAVSVSCGSHSLTPGQSVNIESKNFPDYYPAKEKCRWIFKGTSSDSKLTISCAVFALKACKKSSVTITGGGLRKKYCKKQTGLTETSNDNNMEIFFRTSSSRRRRKGFSCSVSASEVPTTSATTTTSPTTTSTSPASSGTSCQSCGTVNRVTRIVGGVETEVNEYPWQVAIVYAGSNSVFCGGSLLNDLLVVTAAHCVKAMKDYDIAADVLLGAHDVDNPTATQQRIGVSASAYHNQYDESTMDHDIGILLLSSSATLSERVKPVCLPGAAEDYSGYEAVTSGWGTLTEGGSQPSILNEVDVPIVSNEACNEYYDGEITSNMICAGYEEGGKDACQGDSGGPLVVEDNGRWVLAGITSWGYGCARPDFPGVYARATEYIDDLSALMETYGGNDLCDSTASVTSTTSGSLTSTTTTTNSPPSGNCKCGRRNPVTRIVGGQTTTVHEYPWQIGLTSASRPYCGGSIISNQWILTAAHCVDGDSASSVKVLIGEHNWSSTSETSVTEKRDVSQIIVHPQYSSNTYDNDMALLKLSSPISFPSDNKIAPVCLPDAGNAYANVDAVITGWGTTSSGGSQSTELREVTVPTMTNRKCQQSYGSSITSNMICAGLDAGGKDSCQGDSGGPMVTSGNAATSFMVQIGVVSWGYGCASPGYPGVYARVNNYLSWISSNTAGSETCPRP